MRPASLHLVVGSIELAIAVGPRSSDADEPAPEIIPCAAETERHPVGFAHDPLYDWVADADPPSEVTGPLTRCQAVQD